jgi:hypothetical protein
MILKLDSKNMMDDKEIKKENKYEYGPIILNSRSILSSYTHNSSVEFLRKKTHLMALINITTYIAIFQYSDD